MARVIRVRLDEQNFRDLVAGKEIDVSPGLAAPTVSMILADIGWDRMIDAVADAMVLATADMDRAAVIDMLTEAFLR